jgi:hypothetical protein
MDMKPAEVKPPTEAEIKRASDIAEVKAKVIPLRELETVSIRPCCNDVIFAYAAIDGVGRPDNFHVDYNTLWEQEAIDEYDKLMAAMESARDYFENYAFPVKPVEEVKPE